MATDTALVRCERHDRVLLLLLNRPEQLNAISTAMLARLDEIIAEVDLDTSVGAVVIAGEGRAFSAGADIAELASMKGPFGFSAFIQRMTDVYERLERLCKPTIAAVGGVALGGGFELVLACDLRIMSERARVGLPEIKLGLLPGGGGTQRLARLVPAPVAKQLLMTGEPLHAQEALRLGIVNEVVPAGETTKRALELAATLADGPALALAAVKRLVDLGRGLPLASAVAFERETVSMLFGSSDGQEGVRAFIDKRQARFAGA